MYYYGIYHGVYAHTLDIPNIGIPSYRIENVFQKFIDKRYLNYNVILTDSWNMAHTTIAKIKNTTDSLILQSYAANAPTCTVTCLRRSDDIYTASLNNNLFVKH